MTNLISDLLRINSPGLLVTLNNGTLIFLLMLSGIVGIFLGAIVCSWATNGHYKDLMKQDKPSDLYIVDEKKGFS